MKTSLYSRFLLPVLFLSWSLPAGANPSFGYEERDHHNGEQHKSDTEKAVAGVVVTALAIAAAKAIADHNKKHKNRQPAYQPPQHPAWQPDYSGQDNTVIVRIRTAGGQIIPIYLHRTRSGYVGPRGEYYRTLPSRQTLENIYGGREQTRPGQGQAPLHVSVEQGRVRVVQGQRTVCVLYPAMPFVENYRLTSDKRQIVIKSRGNHGPASVELFNLRDGSLSDKVLAYAIRRGQPSWARGMEE